MWKLGFAFGMCIPASVFAGLPPPVSILVVGAPCNNAWYSAWINGDRAEKSLVSVRPDKEGIDPFTRTLRYSLIREQLNGPLSQEKVVLAFWMDADSLRLGSVTIEKGDAYWKGKAFAMLSVRDGAYAQTRLVYGQTIPRVWWSEERLSEGVLPPDGCSIGVANPPGLIPFFVALEEKSSSGLEWENRKREAFLLRFEEE